VNDSLHKKYVRLGALRVAHYDEGNGPPILFVHGIPTSCYLWRKVIARLRDRFRCIAPDLFGLGDTEGPADGDMTMPAQAEMLRDLLAEKGIERAHLVCHDQGGAAAQNLVASHPESVDRWVITNCVAYDNWPVPVIRVLQAVAARPWLFWAVGETGLGHLLARSRIGFRRAVADPACYGDAVEEDLRPTHPSRRPATARAAAQERLRRFALAGSSEHTLSVLPGLRRFEHPTLVLWAEEDRFLPLRWGQRLAEDIPGVVRLETVPGCGHFLPEERPDLLAERIATFCGDAEGEPSEPQPISVGREATHTKREDAPKPSR
jgi:pimeloyl-ACP methyl ester carboxylesterase